MKPIAFIYHCAIIENSIYYHRDREAIAIISTGRKVEDFATSLQTSKI
jgi:hypothetical protein